MKFSTPLLTAKIIKRYKRFLADVLLPSGEEMTVYVPNTGSLLTCIEPGWKVALSHHPDSGRKLPFTLEMIHNGKCWIGLNTGLANTLVEEAIQDKTIKELPYPLTYRREVSAQKSRFDFYLESSLNKEKIFLEVKNVTYQNTTKKKFAQFPDAITTRGTKHLNDLLKLKQQGYRAIIFYIVQREDVSCFAPAAHIDPTYAATLSKAIDGGVEILIYQAKLSLKEICITNALPLEVL